MAKSRLTKGKGPEKLEPTRVTRDDARSVRPLTEADVRRAVSTQVRRATTRLESRLQNTIRDTIQTTISTVSPAGWQGPQQPVAPVGIPPDEPDVRLWEYTPGYNVNWKPRAFQPYSFAQLIWISQNLDILAEVIERRKDEILTSGWELIDPADEEISDDEKNVIHQRLEFPDRIHPFSTWARMVLHQMYVIDASAVYLHRTQDGGIYSLDVVDGSTITPLVNQAGKTPEPNEGPAYLQVINGTPYSLLEGPGGLVQAVDEKGKLLESATATRNELIYFPRNPRPHSPMYGFCYHPDTEVLTRRGWLKFANLREDDDVATRNERKGFEWQRPTHHWKYHYDGELVNFYGRDIDICVTPNHRMLAERRRPHHEEIDITAEELENHGFNVFRIPVTCGDWHGKEIGEKRFDSKGAMARARKYLVRALHDEGLSYGRISALTGAPRQTIAGHVQNRHKHEGTGGYYGSETVMSGDDYCAFMGAWLSEGSLAHGRTILVTQRRTSRAFGAYQDMLARVFRDGVSYNGKDFSVTRTELAAWLTQFGKAHEKYIPDDIMNASSAQIALFLQYFWLGDGTGGRDRGTYFNNLRFITTSSRLADQLQELLQKIGLVGSITLFQPHGAVMADGRVIKAENQRLQYVVTVTDSPYRAFKTRREVYHGPVYCVTVPNHTIYVRRNYKAAWCKQSQTEMAVMSIAIALKLEQAQLFYFTSGNVPESLISVPDTWTAAQITRFQQYFDAMLRGNISRRSGSAIFVPGGMKPAIEKDYKFQRDEFEWLARVICATFHVSPTAYVSTTNRATAETIAVMAMQEGLKPDQVWFTSFMNLMLRIGFGTKLRFSFKDETQFDPDKQAAADQIDIHNGVKTITEVRMSRGLEPYPDELGDQPIFVSTQGVALLRDIEAQSAASTQQAQVQANHVVNPPQTNGAVSEQSQNGKEPAAQSKETLQAQNGNGKEPPAAEKLLEAGAAYRLIRKGGIKYIENGSYLVPLNDEQGKSLL